MTAASTPLHDVDAGGKSPLVSVIMTTYNRALLLGRAIESIRRQEFTDWELVIVDDGSTDDSSALIRAYDDTRIRLECTPHRGRAAALNTALARARGAWIAIADSDDWSHPSRLATQLRTAGQDEDVKIIGSFYSIVDPTDRVLRQGRLPEGDADIRALMPVCDSFCFPSGMFHRSVFAAAGTFDESLNAAVDYDFLLRCLGVARFRTIPAVLVAMRRPADAMGIAQAAEQRSTSYRVARRHLEGVIRDEERNTGMGQPGLHTSRGRAFFQLGRLAYYHEDFPLACDALRRGRSESGISLQYLRYYLPARYMPRLLRAARRSGLASRLTAPIRWLSRRNRYVLP